MPNTSRNRSALKRKLGVVLLSGGLDSTTLAVWAKRQGYELKGLTFYYGQRHRRELEAARKVAQILGLEQKVLDVSFFKDLAWRSALTSQEIAVPHEESPDIPPTYVPLRNTLFIALAAALLESEALFLIEERGLNPRELRAAVLIAANIIDWSGYPDCRPEYFEKLAEALNQGSKLGTQYGVKLEIEAPLVFKSKAEIVRLGMELGAPLEHTWSCYEGGEVPCGECDSCRLRAKGFAEAGYEDPLMIRLRREGRLVGK
ncbi:MAG: 7-cyano-7-deazaguanine synthase QueC [Chloroflexi bacterium]|nr:MAG: 7-cyano-7-deazaguanine synthase QueC [Chloroflexota bacterium]